MRPLSLFLRFCSRVAERAHRSYHPERHYMRGPGPACMRRERGSKASFQV